MIYILDIENTKCLKRKKKKENYFFFHYYSVDVGTGSLGQGVAVAAGMAYIGKYMDKASYR